MDYEMALKIVRSEKDEVIANMIVELHQCIKYDATEIKKLKEDTCKWNLEEEDYNTYCTDCGEMFCITEGAPTDNNLKYCMYCGRKIQSQDNNEKK